jgi:murein DD-endopeptidase MepM/ murein hydrolase activator NlpD
LLTSINRPDFSTKTCPEIGEEVSGGVFPLYAHLRCGSIKVKLGQQVTAGQLLGEVGNSGASLQPHLHFQIMSSTDPFPLFQNLLPMKLSLVRRKQGGHWMAERDHSPKSGEHYEFSPGEV